MHQPLQNNQIFEEEEQSFDYLNSNNNRNNSINNNLSHNLEIRINDGKNILANGVRDQDDEEY